MHSCVSDGVLNESFSKKIRFVSFERRTVTWARWLSVDNGFFFLGFVLVSKHTTASQERMGKTGALQRHEHCAYADFASVEVARLTHIRLALLCCQLKYEKFRIEMSGKLKQGVKFSRWLVRCRNFGPNAYGFFSPFLLFFNGRALGRH